VATTKKKPADDGEAVKKPRKVAAKKTEAAEAPAPKKKAPAKKKTAVVIDEAVETTAEAAIEAAPAAEPEAGPAAGSIAETTTEPEKPKKKAVAKKKAAQEAEGEVEDATAAEAPAKAPVAREPEPAPVPPAFPSTEYAVVEKLLTGFVSHEVRKVGVTRAVLGLSGGVDSAVSAAIAVRALGAGNVLGVFLPYSSSSPESEADARAVAESLGIELLVVDITPQVDAYFARFPDASRLRRGNKMARERMTILYDHSAARSALVIGTSNKTELLLGYGTLYGDMASALNPIGDLYKTQVWGLARHLALPASVIDKAPTADLWSGQTDENELGFSYHEVDTLLYRMIDERCSTGELAALGFDPAFVERISRMVRSSQFKRRLPVIAKLSARSIDTDFRYSRDWGL
jgi:NAD+ synthase